MKLGVFAVFFGFSLAAVLGRADASPFCPADVGFMAPWDYASDAPAPGDSSAHYAYRLKDDGADVLSGHITLAGDAQTYTVPFSAVHFTDSNNPPSDPDPIGDEYAADGAFLALPAPAAIRYAWVSDVTDSTGAVTTCPIFPFKLQTLTAQQRSQMSAPAPPHGLRVVYRDVMAQEAAPLAPANCPVPYRDAAPDGEISRYTRFYDPSITAKPTVRGAAAVDPGGKVIATAILESSGSQVYDNAAKEEFAVQKFNTALFDCRPAAGIYFFAVEYQYRK